MKLWLISQTVNDDYDTYDSAVVAAPDEATARLTRPTQYRHPYNEEWAAPEHIAVKYIGETTELAGVILASFNAG
jgi:hypothetical protein